MLKRVRAWADPLIVGILLALLVGLFVPLPGGLLSGVDRAGDVAIFALFFVYGLRLSTREVIGGLRNWKLQGGIFASTFVLFPLLGLLIHWAAEPLLGAALATGVLYLTLLPSTVQSSVAFVSVARGNIAGAICAATISNVAGMFLTPLLVLWLMNSSGSQGLGGIQAVLLQLLLPFILGQLLQPFFGEWVRGHRPLTKVLDQGTVILLVFSAVASATADGVWSQVSWLMLVALLGISGVLLTVMLFATWFGGSAMRLPREDRTALLMCGSKKSLATGLPMALVIFPAATAATIAVPVIIFHQLQLVVCAGLARRIARG